MSESLSASKCPKIEPDDFEILNKDDTHQRIEAEGKKKEEKKKMRPTRS